MKRDTANLTYAKRLEKLEHKRWKNILDVQRPYRWNLRRLKPGVTLDVGCGIGRNLKSLPQGSVGVDHNKHSIKFVREHGMQGHTTEEFFASKDMKKNHYDSILLGHVLEHLTYEDAKNLLAKYLPCLKKSGRIIIFCPQEKGYSSDDTHITFFDHNKIQELLKNLSIVTERKYSFPFPRFVGKVFKYNEFVVVGSLVKE